MANKALYDFSTQGSSEPVEYYNPDTLGYQNTNPVTALTKDAYPAGSFKMRYKNFPNLITTYPPAVAVVGSAPSPAQLNFASSPSLDTRLSGFINPNQLYGTATTPAALQFGTAMTSYFGAGQMSATHDGTALVLTKPAGGGVSVWTLPIKADIPFWCMEMVLDGVTYHPNDSAELLVGVFKRDPNLSGIFADMSYRDGQGNSGQGKSTVFVNGSGASGSVNNGAFQATGRITHYVVCCNNFLSVCRKFDDGTIGYGAVTKLDDIAGVGALPVDKAVLDSHYFGIGLSSGSQAMSQRVVSVRVSTFQGNGISDDHIVHDQYGKPYRDGNYQYFIASTKGLPTPNRSSVDHSVTGIYKQNLLDDNDIQLVGHHGLLDTATNRVHLSNCGEYIYNTETGKWIIIDQNWGDLGVLDANSIQGLKARQIITSTFPLTGRHLYSTYTQVVVQGKNYYLYDTATAIGDDGYWYMQASTQTNTLDYTAFKARQPYVAGQDVNPTAWVPYYEAAGGAAYEGNKIYYVNAAERYFVSGKGGDSNFYFSKFAEMSVSTISRPQPVGAGQPPHPNIYTYMDNGTFKTKLLTMTTNAASFNPPSSLYTNGALRLYPAL